MKIKRERGEGWENTKAHRIPATKMKSIALKKKESGMENCISRANNKYGQRKIKKRTKIDTNAFCCSTLRQVEILH